MDSATRVTIISTDCSLRKELESAEFCWWLINIHSAILFLVKLDGRFEFDSSLIFYCLLCYWGPIAATTIYYY